MMYYLKVNTTSKALQKTNIEIDLTLNDLKYLVSYLQECRSSRFQTVFTAANISGKTSNK